MRFGLLGATEVDGASAGAPRARQVLARLLAARGGVVTDGQLLEDLWPDPLSKGATASLQATISRLRARLGPDAIERRADGYRVDLRDHVLDVAEMEELVGDARRASVEHRPVDALRAAEQALALFRGAPFHDIAETDIGRSEAVRCEELRAACAADRAASLVELGHGTEALVATDHALRDAPYDERLWALKMTALYRLGRQAEALAAYEDARRILREDLGLDPAPSLRRVHAAVLAHDEVTLGLPEVPLAPTASPNETAVHVVLPAPQWTSDADVHIAFRTFGDGPLDIVWLPDFLFHLDVAWECPRYARYLDGLAGLGRLITFDKRGQGLSDRTMPSPTLEQRVTDLRSVLDGAGTKRAVLVGSSEGAMVATHAAALHDERIVALVLIGSAPVGEPEDGAWALPMDEYVDWIDWASRGWGTGRTLRVMAPSVADDPVERAWYARLERQTIGPGGVRAYGRANAQSDYRAVLPLVRVPTLVLHRREEVVPLEGSRFIARAIEGARFVELDGTDHLVWYGDTDAVLDEVKAFVTTL